VLDKLLVKREIVLESQDELAEHPVQKAPAAQEFQDAAKKRKDWLDTLKTQNVCLEMKHS
jgi:hypothetical protein